MKRSSPVVAAYLALVFGSGAAVGVFGHRLYSAKAVEADASAKTAHPKTQQEIRQKYLRQHETRLHLSPDQMQKLTVILDNSRAKFKAARDRMEPEMKQISEQQRANIREMLNADQKVEYEKMLEERERRRKAQSNGGGGF